MPTASGASNSGWPAPLRPAGTVRSRPARGHPEQHAVAVRKPHRRAAQRSGRKESAFRSPRQIVQPQSRLAVRFKSTDQDRVSIRRQHNPKVFRTRTRGAEFLARPIEPGQLPLPRASGEIHQRPIRHGCRHLRSGHRRRGPRYHRERVADGLQCRVVEGLGHQRGVAQKQQMRAPAGQRRRVDHTRIVRQDLARCEIVQRGQINTA